MTSPVDIAALFGRISQDNLVPCRIGFGKTNFPTGVTSFGSFIVSPPFKRKSAILPINKVKGGFDGTYLCGQIKEHGAISICDVEHGEGDIVMLQVSGKRTQGGSLVTLRDGVLFLKLRKNAPEWEVFGRMPREPANILGDRTLLFRGRADLLSVEDLRGDGLEPHGGYIAKFMDAEEIEECFVLTQTQDEIAPRSRVIEVQAKDGTVTRKELPAVPRRRMMMRKGSQ